MLKSSGALKVCTILTMRHFCCNSYEQEPSEVVTLILSSTFSGSTRVTVSIPSNDLSYLITALLIPIDSPPARPNANSKWDMKSGP